MGNLRCSRLVVVFGIAVFAVVGGNSIARLMGSNQTNVKWGRAAQLRGATRIELGRDANLYALSCSAPGTCSAVGSYAVRPNHNRAIVVNELDGRWGKVEALPGLRAVDDGLNTGAYVVSCVARGNCGAGGTYSVSPNELLVFVVEEHDGVWGRAVTVPGVRVDETGGFADLATMSCASVGTCSAGGEVAGSNGARAFIVNEVRGTWGAIHPIASTPSYSMRGSTITSISCPSIGDCSAVGTGQKQPYDTPPFSVSESHGVWGRPEEVPGLAALSPGGSDYEISLSCASVGSCSARGTYRARTGVTQSFLVGETRGVWGRAFDVPGIVALDGRHLEQLNAISCGSPGNCSAGGAYGTGSHEQAFLVNEANGRWGDPMSIPGLATLNQGPFTSITDVSCSAAGTCGAIGTYGGPHGYVQAFALNESRGTWGDAVRIGTSASPHSVGASGNGLLLCRRSKLHRRRR